jgi:AAA+ ATPase superfamily predicted ATPase
MLALESFRDRDNAVYYQATRGASEQQIASFMSDIGEASPGITRIRGDWEPILEYLAEEDATVIIDEFPYLVEQTDSFPSILQRVWDHTAQDTVATFVLTGSAIGMMHEYALEGNARLYHRLSKNPNDKIEVGPLQFNAAMSFFPDYGSSRRKPRALARG